jgi:multicomponent Na+:H+ antiporter subunit E
MRTLTLNLLIAVIWLLLSPRPGGAAFLIGFGMGLGLLWLFQSVLPPERYFARVAGTVRFVVIFLREFIVANFEMLHIVLFRSREDLHPKLFTLDVRGMKPWEILLLSQCISLTPGTTSVQIEDDFETLVIHALDAEDTDQLRQKIDRTLRRAVLGMSRG